MSILKSEDSNKWINLLIALAAAIVGFLMIRFVDQLSIWFDLETKIPNINFYSQAVGVALFVFTGAFLIKNPKSSSYLQEVFNELLKVVWPSRDTTIKITFGLVIALAVISSIFVSVDFIFKKILSFVY